MLVSPMFFSSVTPQNMRKGVLETRVGRGRKEVGRRWREVQEVSVPLVGVETC